MLLSLVALALAPGAALALFFYLMRPRIPGRQGSAGRPAVFHSVGQIPVRHRRLSLLVTLMLGGAVIAPAVVISLLLEEVTGWRPQSGNLFQMFLFALVVVGMVEEGWKFLVVRFYSYSQLRFREPYDGIMYSVLAALGFATVENILYVLDLGATAGVLRAFLAVPGHAFFGVLMGFFLGEAKFAGSRTRAVLLSAAGLGSAVLAHGVYNFMVFAMAERPLLLLMLPVFFALAWVVFFSAARRHTRQSPNRREDLVRLQPGRD